MGSQHSNLKPTMNRFNQNNLAVVSNVTGIFLPSYDSSGANSNSTIHLPPLHAPNPNKYIEKQRRTQLLQKQRLKKEYFN